MTLTTFDTISISGNSSHKGIAYFYNPVNIESCLNVSKNLSIEGILETNSLNIGSWILQNKEDNLSLKNNNSFSAFQIGDNINLISNPGFEKLSLGNFNIIDKFKETQFLKNDTPLISIFKEKDYLIEFFTKLKCNDLLINNASIQNLNVNGALSVNQILLKNELTLPKETPIIFSLQV